MAAEMDRSPRDKEIRAEEQRGLSMRNPEEFRKFEWAPNEALPMPKHDPAWHYRYVRKSVGAWQDVSNYGRYMRNGWEPVPLSDHTELMTSINPDAKNSNIIEIGALILCRIPTELKQKQDAYYQKLTNRQMEAVNNNLMRENDPRMPLFKEHKSEVTFGKGF